MKKLYPLILVSCIFALTGENLVIQMDEKLNPENSTSNISMLLTNKNGKTRTSIIHSIIKDNGEKQITWFLSPSDDKGIAFLKIEHENKKDEMKIWLPAFKKVKRISIRKRSDSFMGSDISYEDMSNRKRKEYDFNIIGQESLNGSICHILKSIPKEHIQSEYSHHHTWVDTSLLIPLKEKSYDKNGNLLKEKQFSYVKINTYQILNQIQVKNIQKNHSTQLTFDNIMLNLDIKDEIFHERYLKHLPN
jgi:outer membrane lipoprotein-sorting protein